MSDEASPAQKLNIATYFIMSSPPGEVDEVVQDVKKLVSDPSVLSDAALNNILKEYNTEQLTQTNTPSGSSLLLSKYGEISSNEYLEPNTGSVYTVNHVTRTVTEETDKKQVLNDKVESIRKAIHTKLDGYIKDNFKQNKVAYSVYGADNGLITICISAKNVNLSNYWSGSWRSVYTLNTSGSGSAELKGTAKIVVHYYEDGNVQLHANNSNTAAISLASAESIASDVRKSIESFETSYQNNLEEMYVNMHRSTFKQMRRFLTITKDKFKWNSAAHSLASEVNNRS